MRRNLFSVVIAVVALVAVALILREPIGYFFFLQNVPNGLISFFRQGDLYIMDSQASNQCRIAEGDLGYPAWSPDGARLAFVARDDFELFVVNANGSDVRQLAVGNPMLAVELPSWSPDSTQLVYVGRDEQGENIVTVADVASGETRVIANSAPSPIALSWSPDGARLAVIAGEDELWVMDADGGSARSLGVNVSHTVRAPQWLPDSQQVIVVSNAFELVLVNIEDGSVQQLTTLEANHIGGVFDFLLSPDGQQILFTVLMNGSSDINLYRVAITGGEMLRVSEGNFSDWDVTWLPDGQQAVIVREQGDTGLIMYRLSIESGELQRLGTGRDPSAQPAQP